MLFNSTEFFLFFPCVYVAYLLCSSRVRWQNGLLLAASYVFYGAWDYRFLSLVIASTLIDYLAAIRIQRARAIHSHATARAWLSFSVCANLVILGFFKYFNFFTENLVALGQAVGLTLPSVTLQVVLPVGISFYTFQTMGYTIDVYRGQQTPTKNLLDFALFVAFFPQLLAGPIERAKHLLPQLQAPRRITARLLHDGAWLISWGLFKKVCIADHLAPYSAWAFTQRGAGTSLDVYLAIVAFSIQLYGDFSGYSDMARGLGKWLGIELSKNFNLPFLASNPSDVWRRWHMTLVAWFRDYVYKPLSGLNRHGRVLAILPTWLLVGLWHGADWTFVTFGGLWGVTLLLHWFVQPYLLEVAGRHAALRAFMYWSGIILTFHLWLVLLLFFVATDMAHGVELVRTLVTDGSVSAYSARDAVTIFWYAWPLLLIEGFQYRAVNSDVMERLPAGREVVVYCVLMLLAMAYGAELKQEFIYFQF